MVSKLKDLDVTHIQTKLDDGRNSLHEELVSGVSWEDGEYRGGGG